eukprot:CAMPEP_0184753034 /NCGR_PEP_ID=MMETSP0315-20130426/43892_1 /TAXON_ID=101924 /ORGANISM="Rhodosorus marinus, Strain UTEX LB 2760" /LENGTH=345 /DNA_ID=CAMNT_0027232395 /DNA_START=118 /DNA_END=1154 /DNA_ORIENTATION=-
MTSLEEQFAEAVNSVSSGGVSLGSQEDQLKLYGYYTRVKKGVCKGPRPGPWEFRKQAKYDAWKDVSETRRDDAMQEYIEIVRRLAAGSGGVRNNVQSKRPLGFAVEDDEHDVGPKAYLRTFATALPAAGSGGVRNNVQSKRPLGFAVEDDEHNSGMQGSEGSALQEMSYIWNQNLNGELLLPMRLGTNDIPPDVCLCASQGDMKSLVHCLKVQKVSPNYVDADGMTPLMCAADRDHKDIVLYLLRHGALPNGSDVEGFTALHYAVLCANFELAVLLVKYGADMHHPNAEGGTPFQLANEDTKQLLANAEKSSERYNFLLTRVAVPTLIATAGVLTAALLYQWRTW